jgi:release factor glutamine methyltransferase
LGSNDPKEELLTQESPALPVVSGLALWQWRQDACKSAVEANVSTTEVDWLLQEVAGLDPLALRLESYKGRLQIELRYSLSRLSDLWHRRLHDRLPVQYLVGVTPWRHFSLKVSPAVLIPRPETEYLIDLARMAVREGLKVESLKVEGSHQQPQPSNLQSANLQLEQGHWVDLGTGSGAIAIGLADAFPAATIHAVDYSADALSIAQLNAQQLGFAERIQFYQGSWWEPLVALQGQVSGMVANPPYIPSSWIQELQPEVRHHEPHLALDGGSDGLDYIRQLIEISPDYLRSGGIWLIEMMAGQADTVVQLLHQQGSYCNIQIFSDLAGIERFALAYRREGVGRLAS